jgi:hypothetical protein
MDTINTYGAACGMIIGGENRNIRKNRSSMSFCLSQIPHYLTCDGTPIVTVGRPPPIARAMAQSQYPYKTKIMEEQI